MEKVYSSPLRWTGSKKKLLNEMLIMFDKNKRIYIEPFLGSGIVLINTIENNMFEEYYVNDVNESLINFYVCLKENLVLLCGEIKRL